MDVLTWPQVYSAMQLMKPGTAPGEDSTGIPAEFFTLFSKATTTDKLSNLKHAYTPPDIEASGCLRPGPRLEVEVEVARVPV